MNQKFVAKRSLCNRLALALVAVLAIVPSAAWCQASPAGGGPKPAEALVIRHWGYQLSNIDPNEIAASDYDAVVIDYARDGRQQTALSATEVERMKLKPDGGRRVVLAYLSVGEAEQYRYYWNRRWSWAWGWYGYFFGPSWLGRENPDWRGNFAVRYWNDDWQALICGPGDTYLGRIVAAGFDGVWLDKIDASTEPIARGRPNRNGDMVSFVARIAARARAERPTFLIVPQNGEHLLSDPRFSDVVSGMGAESLLFGDPDAKKPTSLAIQGTRIPPLQKLIASGKPVLAVEYLDDAADIAAARTRLQQLGFSPHFADRNLDSMRFSDMPDAPAGKP